MRNSAVRDRAQPTPKSRVVQVSSPPISMYLISR